MRRTPLKLMGGAIATAFVALMLIGCRGAAGQNGLNGTNGTNGNDGNNGSNGAGPTINAAVLTPDLWSQVTLKGSIQSVTMGAAPIVNFTVTDGFGMPMTGLGMASKSSTALAPSLNNMAFTIAKLVPGTNGSPSKWVNYIVTTMPASASATTALHLPGTDNTGTLVDHGNGTYTYTFYRNITQIEAFRASQPVSGANDPADLGDVSYQANLTHRLGIQLGGPARGTGKNTPDGSTSSTFPTNVNVKTAANLIYDFIPATGQPVTATDQERLIVDMSACNSCHTKLSWHGDNRVDVQYCVMCHTDQMKYGFEEATTTSTGYTGETRKINGMAVGNFPKLIHMIHTGELLKKTGYAFSDINPFDARFPQDQRNCTKCHTGNSAAANYKPQGDNWKNVPSRLACGACHDNIDWATGTNHGVAAAGGPQLSDQNCVNCHAAADITTYHTPTVAPDAANYIPGSHTNGSTVAGYANILPAGAHRVTWDLKSVSLDSSRHPVFVFRFLEDGARKDFNTASSTVKTFWDNYVGSPSIYVAFGTPQDGITSPSDWNTTASTSFIGVWNGTATGAKAGTLSSPDSSGYYTLTMTGTVVPDGATMVTGGIGYTYGYGPSMPLTQTAVPGFPYNATTYIGGVSVPAPNASKVASGFTARRTIVNSQNCNSCHAVLGIFTDKVYHAGERNDAGTCSFCHNVNRVNSGWGVNQKDFIHAIHGASKRQNKFSWEATAGDDYWNTTYPGSEKTHLLNNCEACHVPGSYDFSATANAAAVPNLLWTTVATGPTDPAAFPIITGDETVTSSSKVISPFITPGVNYGAGYAFNLGTGVATNAAGTTLVNSPITSACSSCHDSQSALAHMTNNGGVFYAPRNTVINPSTGKFNQVEQCLVCHGTGRTADIRTVHMTFK